MEVADIGKMFFDDDMNFKRLIIRQLNLPSFFSIVIDITRTDLFSHDREVYTV